MLRVATGLVVEVIEERQGVQELSVIVDGRTGAERAVSFTSAGFACEAGDRVLLNLTAVTLGLGTGGVHFVIAKLPFDSGSQEMRAGSGSPGEREEDWYPTTWGHVMKCRYTPLQLAVDAVEEAHSPWHALLSDETLNLMRTPVVIGELHSMLPMVALALKRLEPDVRIVYVMPDGAALSLAVSRHAHHLKGLGVLAATVSCGQAWGGDYEAVNLHTGLLAAKHIAGADVILCMPGPGVVGTGTPLGFSGIQVAEMIHAASLLDGIPIVVPRVSFADPRERHVGISHHTRTVLTRFALRPALVPIPAFGDQRDEVLEQQAAKDGWPKRHYRLSAGAVALDSLKRVQAGYPETITTMGRDVHSEPSLFQTAWLAAQVAQFVAERMRALRDAALPPGRDALAMLAALWVNVTNGEA